MKHYSGETGFQYQYRLESSSPGHYRFTVWTAAQPARSVRIVVPLPYLEPRDRYALAKLKLFRAFDQLPPAELPVAMEVTDSAPLDELQSAD